MKTTPKPFNPLLFLGITLGLLAYSMFAGSRAYLSSSDSYTRSEGDRYSTMFSAASTYWGDVDLGQEESNYDPVQLDSLNYSTGDLIGKVEIPAIGVDSYVLSGSSLDVLRQGVGHYDTTSLPGEDGNSVITAHRSSFGEIFHDADKLSEGDEVIITLPTGGKVVYEITESFIVKPSETWVLDPISGVPSSLTLITCDPVDSTEERLIVRAQLREAPSDEVAFIGEQNEKTRDGKIVNLVGNNETFEQSHLYGLISLNIVLAAAAAYTLMSLHGKKKIISAPLLIGLVSFPLLYGIVLI